MDGLFEVYDADGGEEDDLLFAPSVSDYPIGCRVKIAAERISTNTTVPSWIKTELASLPPVIKGFVLRHQGEFSYVSFTVGDDPSNNNNNNNNNNSFQEKEINVVHFTAMIHRGFLSSPQAKYRPEEEKQLLSEAAETVRERSRTPKELSNGVSPLNASNSSVREAELALRSHLHHQQSNLSMLATRIIAGTGESFDSQARGSLRHHPFDSPHHNNHSAAGSALPQPQSQPQPQQQSKENTINVKKLFASSSTNHPQFPQNQDITTVALVRIRNLRDEGNAAFSKGKIDDAIIKYSEAMTWIPCSVFTGASSTSPANTTTINSTNTSFYRKSNLSNMSSHQQQHQHLPSSSAPASYLSSDQLLQHQHSLLLTPHQNTSNTNLANNNNNNNNASSLSGVSAGGALMLRSALKAHRRAHKSKCSALQEQQEYEQDVTFLNQSVTSQKQKQNLQMKGNENFIVAPQPQRNVMHFSTGGVAANVAGGASSSQGTSPSLSSSTYPTINNNNNNTLPQVQRPQPNSNNNNNYSATSPSSGGAANQSTPIVAFNFPESVLAGGDSGVSNRDGSTPQQQQLNNTNNSSDINKNTSSNNNSTFTPPLFPLSTTPASTHNTMVFPLPHVASTLPPDTTVENMHNDAKASSTALQMQQQQQQHQHQQQQNQLQIQQYLMKREFRDECCTLLVNRSTAFLQQRSVRSAIRDAVAAVQLDPRSRRALMAQANSAGAANLFKYSLQALRMLYVLDPTDGAAQLGWCRSMISAFYTSALLRRTQECCYSVSSVAAMTSSCSPTGSNSNSTNDTTNASANKLLLGKSPPSQEEGAKVPPSSASIIGLIPGKSLPQQPGGRNYYSPNNNNNPASSNRQNNNNNNNNNTTGFSLLNASISALGADDSITTATNLLAPASYQGFIINNNNNASGALLFRASLSSTSQSGLGATTGNINNNFGGGTNELVGGLTKSQQLPFPQNPFATSQQLPPGSVGLNSLLNTSNCNQKDNQSLTPMQQQIQIFRRQNTENSNNNNNNERSSGSTSPQSQWIAGITINQGFQEASPLNNNNNNNNNSASCRSPSLLLQQQLQSSPVGGGGGTTTSVAASASASVQSSPFSCIEENGRLKIHSRHFFKAGELICCEYPVCLKVALLKKNNVQNNNNNNMSDFQLEQKQQEILNVLSSFPVGGSSSSSNWNQQASKRKIEDYFCAACGRDILGLNNLLSDGNNNNNNSNSHITKLMSKIAAAPSLPHPLFVPCDNCDSVVYCSEECRNLDSTSHSKFLCNGTGLWANALRSVDVYFNTARQAPELVPYFASNKNHNNNSVEVDVVDASMSSLGSSQEKSRGLHQPPVITATASPPSSSRGLVFGNNNNNNNNMFLSASGNLHLDPNEKPTSGDNSGAVPMPTSGRRSQNSNNNNTVLIATASASLPPSQFSSKYSIQDVSKMNFVVKLAMTIAAKRLSNDLLREVTGGMNFSDVKAGAPPSTVSGGPNSQQTTPSAEVAVSELSSLSSWANCNSRITQQKVFSSSASLATHHFASPYASKPSENADEQSLASILFLLDQQLQQQPQKLGVNSTSNNNNNNSLPSSEMQKHQLLQPAPSATSTFFAANYGSGIMNNNNNNNKTSPTEKPVQSTSITSFPPPELLAKQLQAATPIKQWLKQLRQVYDQFPTQTRIIGGNTNATSAANFNNSTPLPKRHNNNNNSLPPSPSATISPTSLTRRIEEQQREQELKNSNSQTNASSCCCYVSFESFLRFVLLALGGCVNVSENNISKNNNNNNNNRTVSNIPSPRFVVNTIACFEMISLISFGSRKEFWWNESINNSNNNNNNNNVDDGAIREKEQMQMILGGSTTNASNQQVRAPRPVRRIKTEYDQVVFSKDDTDNEDGTNATPGTGRRGDNNNNRDDTEDRINSNNTIVHNYVKLICAEENIAPGDCLVAE